MLVMTSVEVFILKLNTCRQIANPMSTLTCSCKLY